MVDKQSLDVFKYKIFQKLDKMIAFSHSLLEFVLIIMTN